MRVARDTALVVTADYAYRSQKVRNELLLRSRHDRSSEGWERMCSNQPRPHLLCSCTAPCVVTSHDRMRRHRRGGRGVTAPCGVTSVVCASAASRCEVCEEDWQKEHTVCNPEEHLHATTPTDTR